MLTIALAWLGAVWLFTAAAVALVVGLAWLHDENEEWS